MVDTKRTYTKISGPFWGFNFDASPYGYGSKSTVTTLGGHEHPQIPAANLV